MLWKEQGAMLRVFLNAGFVSYTSPFKGVFRDKLISFAAIHPAIHTAW